MFLKQKYFHSFAFLTLFFASQSIYALEPIDTQIGQDGMSVHLMKAKVSNGVLTASVLFDNDVGTAVTVVRPDLNEIHYVAGTKKYPVLKDTNGDWLASPVHDESKLFEKDSSGGLYLSKKRKMVAWFKFPAPPEGTTTIEISVPGVTPFTAELVQ